MPKHFILQQKIIRKVSVESGVYTEKLLLCRVIPWSHWIFRRPLLLLRIHLMQKKSLPLLYEYGC